MEEDHSSGFRIGLDEPEPETAKPKQAPREKAAKGKKPARKEKKHRDTAMFMVFLAFVVVALVMGWFYLDVNDRLRAINTSGSDEMSELSRTLNTRMESITNQLAGMEKSLEKRLGQMEARVEDAAGRMDQFNSGIASLEKSVASVEKTLKPLREQVEGLAKEFAGLEKTAKNLQAAQVDLKTRMEERAERLQELSQRMEAFSENRVSPAMIEDRLEKEREFYKTNMAHSMETVFSELASIEERLQGFREDINEVDKELDRLGQDQAPEKTGGSEKAPPENSRPSTAETMPVPKEGEIVEQEIE
jgi:chromosome segregation ATPase